MEYVPFGKLRGPISTKPFSLTLSQRQGDCRSRLYFNIIAQKLARISIVIVFVDVFLYDVRIILP